jgi:hypothetical protein
MRTKCWLETQKRKYLRGCRRGLEDKGRVTVISSVSVPCQFRISAVREVSDTETRVACILNKTTHTYPAH